MAIDAAVDFQGLLATSKPMKGQPYGEIAARLFEAWRHISPAGEVTSILFERPLELPRTRIVAYGPAHLEAKPTMEKETIENRISELETRIDRIVQTTLRHSLTPKEIKEITELSKASLQNIVTIQRLAKGVQETSNQG